MDRKNIKVGAEDFDPVLIEMKANLFLMNELRFVGVAKGKPVPRSAEQVALEEKIRQRREKSR